MTKYELRSTQILPITLNEAWAFFSNPLNLASISPSFMKLRILKGHEEGGIRPGLRIHIAVSPILGIPMHWITEIGHVQAPYEFSDTQPKGPFAEWNHTHRFREVDGGVEIIDELQYRLPLGVLGRLAHVLFVRKQIEGIFEHRRRTLERRFAR